MGAPMCLTLGWSETTFYFSFIQSKMCSFTAFNTGRAHNGQGPLYDYPALHHCLVNPLQQYSTSATQTVYTSMLL